MMSAIHKSIVHGTGKIEPFFYVYSSMFFQVFFWFLNMLGFFHSRQQMQAIFILLKLLQRHTKHLALKLLFSMLFNLPLRSMMKMTV